MSILKMVNKTCKAPGYTQKILAYIIDELKTMQQTLTGGYAGGKSAEAMEIVKRLYHKEGGRQVIHAVLAPSCDGYIDPKEYLKLAGYISQFFPDFQSCYAVHTDTKYTHIHIVFNSVNFKTGHKFSMSPSELNQFRQKCNIWLTKFGFHPITESANAIWDRHDYSLTQGFDFLEIPESLLPEPVELPSIDIISDTAKTEPFYNPDYPYRNCNCSEFFSTPSGYSTSSNWRYNDMNNNLFAPEHSSFAPSVSTSETAMQGVFSPVSTGGSQYPTMSLDIGPHLDITASSNDNLSNLAPIMGSMFQEADRLQQAAVNIDYALAKKATGDGIPMNIHVSAAPRIHIDFTSDPVESVPIETSMYDIEDE